MATLPDLETPRLRIIPFDDKLLTECYVGWLNDPEVVRYSEQRHRQHNLESCAAYFHSFAGSPHFFCAILLRENGLHVGNLSVSVDVANRVADISILVGDRGCWGRGIGAEAWQAVQDELLANQLIRKVTAGTMSINHAMLSVMRKCGMEEEGRLKRHFLCEGREVDMVLAATFTRSS